VWAEPVATNEHAIGSNGAEAMKAYREAVFLRLPAGTRELNWRVIRGELEFMDERKGTWVKSEQSFLPTRLEGDWEGFTAGAIQALGRNPFYLEFSIRDEFDLKALGIVDSRLIEVGRKLVQAADGGLLAELSVFSRPINDPGSATKSATFRINEPSFQYRLGSVFQISPQMVGIIAGTEHPEVSSLVLFDLAKNMPVGYLPFSTIQYLPEAKSLWAKRPVTKARERLDPNAPEADDAMLMPVWTIDGALNPELSETDLFTVINSEKTKDAQTTAPVTAATTKPELTSKEEGKPVETAEAPRVEKRGFGWLLFAAIVIVSGIIVLAFWKRS
jgi:hypothetical protein